MSLARQIITTIILWLWIPVLLILGIVLGESQCTSTSYDISCGETVLEWSVVAYPLVVAIMLKLFGFKRIPLLTLAISLTAIACLVGFVWLADYISLTAVLIPIFVLPAAIFGWMRLLRPN